MTDLLQVRGLVTEFATEAGVVRAVDGVDLSVGAGEVLGLVGESGSGKTVTALSILRLIAHPGRVANGQILFEGTDILDLPECEMLALRGNRISMIFQQPKACLNPVIRVGRQIAELFERHRQMRRKEALAKALDLLISVGIPAPEEKINAYPHELSGGQAQRIMIAMALALEPRVLIADEPTTALDVTMQAQILRLLKNMCQRAGTALILVTHDMGVIAQTADRVSVMYAGQVIENQPVHDLFAAPAHPYTRALLASMPDPGAARSRLQAIPGAVPAPGQMPPGCRFAPRCDLRIRACDKPPSIMPQDQGSVRCWNGQGLAS